MHHPAVLKERGPLMEKYRNAIRIIFLAAAAGLALSFASETGAETDNNQKKYLWQSEDYPRLRRDFREVYRRNLESKTPPSTKEELYLWQMEEYKNLREEFRETFERNVEPQTVPETNEELYLWQMQEYPRLRKEFKEPIVKNLSRKEKPFTP